MGRVTSDFLKKWEYNIDVGIVWIHSLFKINLKYNFPMPKEYTSFYYTFNCSVLHAEFSFPFL